MEAKGIELSIPMPGHPIADQFVERTLQDVATLEKLIDEAELVFLLTDTRESRWLPTVLCAARGKPCINVALGFDTFVIIRHGVPDPSAAPDAHGQQPCNLGCYFCNDVVAPTDSTRNRILDQQCTATRPGLSAIASSIAVEIAVSIMHHPNRCLAPSDISGQVSPTHRIAADRANNLAWSATTVYEYPTLIAPPGSFTVSVRWVIIQRLLAWVCCRTKFGGSFRTSPTCWCVVRPSISARLVRARLDIVCCVLFLKQQARFT